jgi:hypothetical protein
MSKIVAKRIVEHLERSGFVVMKKPPIGGRQRVVGSRGLIDATSAGVARRLNGLRKPTPKRSSATMVPRPIGRSASASVT